MAERRERIQHVGQVNCSIRVGRKRDRVIERGIAREYDDQVAIKATAGY